MTTAVLNSKGIADIFTYDIFVSRNLKGGSYQLARTVRDVFSKVNVMIKFEPKSSNAPLETKQVY